jgi:hypothetical protein
MWQPTMTIDFMQIIERLRFACPSIRRPCLMSETTPRILITFSTDGLY